MHVFKGKTPCPFHVVVITAPTESAARAYESEILLASETFPYDFSETLLLSIADPYGQRVGSGGGTLNALAASKAALEARLKAPLILEDYRVLVVHSGGDSQRSPTQSLCGKAWSSLNSVIPSSENDTDFEVCATPLYLLLETLFEIFIPVPNGGDGYFVVTSSDVLLIVPSDLKAEEFFQADVTGLAIPSDVKYAPNHGVFVVDSDSKVSAYLQKPKKEELAKHNALLPGDAQGEQVPKVLIDSGVVVFNKKAIKVLGLMLDDPLFQQCTFLCPRPNVEPSSSSAATALRLEMYSDMLLALDHPSDVPPPAEYMGGSAPDTIMQRAREELWARLGPLSFGAAVANGGKFAHLGTTAELRQMVTLGMPEFIAPFRLCGVAGYPDLTCLRLQH